MDRRSPDVMEVEPALRKVHLQNAKPVSLAPCCMTHIWVTTTEYEGELFIEASVRGEVGQEYVIPGTIICLQPGVPGCIPVFSLADQDIKFVEGKFLEGELAKQGCEVGPSKVHRVSRDASQMDQRPNDLE